MTLDDALKKLIEWGGQSSTLPKLKAQDWQRFNRIVVEIDDSIASFKRNLDLSAIEICFKKIAEVRNIHSSIFRKEYLPTLLDMRLTCEDIANIFQMSPKTIYAYKQDLKKSGKGISWAILDLPLDIEGIEKMSSEEFARFTSNQARLTVIKALSSPNITQFSIDIAKQILISERDQKVRDVEKMWQLCKDWLAWWTGVCIPKLTKKISQARPPFDVKVLAAEVADEKYDEMVKKYREVKPHEETPLEKSIKEAKRRGGGKHKWKKDRKVSGSSVLTESAELPEPSVSEESVDSPPSSEMDTSAVPK